MPGKTLADEWADDMGLPAANIGPREERPPGTGLPKVDLKTGQPVQPYSEATAEYGDPEVAPRSGFGVTRRQRGLVETGAEIAGAIQGSGLGLRAAGGLAKRGLPFFERRLGQGLARTVGAGTGEAGIQQFMVGEEESRLAETSKAFARGALGEAFGLGTAAVVRPLAGGLVNVLRSAPRTRRLVDPFSGKLALGADEAIDQLKPYGVSPTPGQLSTSGLIDNVENVAEASLGGGPIIRAARGRAEKRATQMIRHFAKKFGDMRSTNEVGDLVGSALRNEKEAHRALVRTEVENLDRLGRNEVMVDISDILDAAKAGKRANKSRGNRGVGIERLYDFILLSEKGTVAPGIGAAKGARARQVERVGRSSRVTFKEAQEMRSLLLEAERATDDPLPKITEALAGDLAQKVHGKMELAAKLSGNNRLLQAWQGFNDLVSGGHTQFNNQVMRELMGHTEASRVYTEGIRGMVPPERIRAIRGIIEKGVAGGRVDPIVWQDVQGRWMRDAIEGAVSVETGSVRGKALLEHLKTVGPERMRALFPEDGGAGFRRFARTLYLTQKTATEKEAGGTFGGVAMRILQAGAVLTYPVAMWKGEGETRAATTANLAFILLGPAALARALRNPKAISLITRGMTTGPVEGASRLGNQLQVHLRDILPPGSAYVGEVTDPNQPARSVTPTDPPSIESLAPRGGQ